MRLKSLSGDPARIKGMAERLIICHHDSSCGDAVKRPNTIENGLAERDDADAPAFLINGLKPSSRSR